MSFDKELTHLIERQISSRAGGGPAAGRSYGSMTNSTGDSRIDALEANLQRLADEFTKFIKAQKKAQKNAVEYGLEVIALHDFRLAVTSGRAIFVDLPEPIELPYTYLQLSPAGNERSIRYIYLDSSGLIFETTTDPSNMGPSYLSLAVIDVWADAVEITQSKIKDIRTSAGNDGTGVANNSWEQGQLVGNVTLTFPDMGNDSFVVAAANPAALKVVVSSGRALVDGDIVDAPGGVIDLSKHLVIEQECVGFGDGVKKKFSLYHKNAANVKVSIGGTVATATVDDAAGTITFANAPAAGAAITVAYSFSGNYMLVFLVEKMASEDGQPFGIIGWKAGSNRTPAEPPELPDYQHAIAKIDMSGAITAITNALIDNSYEVKHLTQYDLQYGGNLGEDSLQDGAVTTDKVAANSIIGNKIAANAITGDKIAANTITGNKIVASTITSDKIVVGGIDSANIRTGAITADKIATGVISADKMATNSITIGKMDAATQNSINTAGSNASTALTNAAKAQTAADTAKNNAATAQSAADTAKTNAAKAQSTADSANSTANAVTGTVNGWKYTNTTFIDGGKIYTGSIRAAQIAAGSITADKIGAGAITADKISAGTITADKIVANTITAENINDNATGCIMFEQPGVHTWTVPKGVRRVWVTMCGGGGGGTCTGTYDFNMYFRCGGGGGAYYSKQVQVIPGSQIYITVGAGGQGGTTSSNGPKPSTSGGISAFGGLLSCSGGQAGVNGGAAGGFGGSAGGVYRPDYSDNDGSARHPAEGVWVAGSTIFGVAGIHGAANSGYGVGGTIVKTQDKRVPYTGQDGLSGFVFIQW